MIIKPELVRRIKEYFNLNIYETKVWLALLSKGVASAGEVAEISGVPRSRTYDVLESLEKRGFAITKKRIVDDMGYELEIVPESERKIYFKNNYNFKRLIFMGDGYHDAEILKECAF